MNYGWIVLILITLIEACSGFGRTSSLSPYVKDLCVDLDLTRSQLSGAYTLANLFAGFLLPLIGKFYDKYTTSNFLRIHIAIFGSAFFTLSMLPFLHFSNFGNFIAFIACFSCVRSSVHAYGVVGHSMIATWFAQKRGFATGITCLVLSTIASAMPWINLQLHQFFRWQHIWLTVAICWFCFALPICGFIKKPKHAIVSSKREAHFELNSIKQFLKQPIFWLILAALFFRASQNTGIAFHLIPICEELGAPSQQVTFCFMIISIFSILTTFTFGHYLDKWGIQWSLVIFLLADFLSLLALRFIGHSGAIYFYILFGGLYWGLAQVVTYMIVPKIFGVKWIGTINGCVSASTCLGSSLGPLMLGLIKDHSTYALGLSGFICIALMLGIGSYFCTKNLKINNA